MAEPVAQFPLRHEFDRPLSNADRRKLRASGVPLGFDPALIGFIPLDAVEDLAPPPASGRAGWPSVRDVLARRAPTLRPWRPEDLDAFHEMLDDAALWTHMPTPYPAPLTRDAAAALIELSNAAPHHLVRAVIQDGQPVGQVRLETHSDGRQELSYWLGRAFWGRGIAAKAVQLFLETCVTGPVFARIRATNFASIRVVERAGFAAAGADPQDPDWRLYTRD